MSTATDLRSTGPDLLHTGDRMTQKEFHRLYERMPEDFRAELIGGIVYVSSPVSRQHGRNHIHLGSPFAAYESSTPGVEVGDNTTIVLGDEGEPQPDVYLRILTEYGGQSRVSKKDYVLGAPELIAEIAWTSRAIDLHRKKDDYASYGVLEYLVVCLKEKELRWFDLKLDVEHTPDNDDVFRMRTFPGLWIHGPALLARDHRRLMRTLKQGLKSPEHAEFVRRLESQRTKKSKPRKRKS